MNVHFNEALSSTISFNFQEKIKCRSEEEFMKIYMCSFQGFEGILNKNLEYNLQQDTD